jgi:hypothetical protein
MAAWSLRDTAPAQRPPQPEAHVVPLAVVHYTAASGTASASGRAYHGLGRTRLSALGGLARVRASTTCSGTSSVIAGTPANNRIELLRVGFIRW